MMTNIGDWVYTDTSVVPDEILFSTARIGLPDDYGLGLVIVFIACNHHLNPEPMCYVDVAERVDGEWIDVDGEPVEVDERGQKRRVVAWTAMPILQF